MVRSLVSFTEYSWHMTCFFTMTFGYTISLRHQYPILALVIYFIRFELIMYRTTVKFPSKKPKTSKSRFDRTQVESPRNLTILLKVMVLTIWYVQEKSFYLYQYFFIFGVKFLRHYALKSIVKILNNILMFRFIGSHRMKTRYIYM